MFTGTKCWGIDCEDEWDTCIHKATSCRDSESNVKIDKQASKECWLWSQRHDVLELKEH